MHAKIFSFGMGAAVRDLRCQPASPRTADAYQFSVHAFTPSICTVTSTDVQHHCPRLIGDPGLLHHACIPLGIFGARQLLLEGVQSETVVNALVQDAAKALVTLKDDDMLRTVPYRHGCGA